MVSVVDLVRSLPALSLTAVAQNQLFQYLESRLQLLAYKLRESPYHPCKTDDPLGLNENPLKAIYDWLQQFPEVHRLGALSVALSTSYISRFEMDHLLDACYAQLSHIIEEQEVRTRSATHDLHAYLKRALSVHPLSEFEEYSAFVHRAQIEGTADATYKTHATVKEFLFDIFESLRYVADYSTKVYYPDETFGFIHNTIERFTGRNIVLVENASFSGTTVSSDVKRLLTLLIVLFQPFESTLRERGLTLPRVYLLLPVTTSNALAAIDRQLSPQQRRFFEEPIVGQTFSAEESLGSPAPIGLTQLNAILGQKGSVAKAVQKTVQYFCQTHATSYWSAGSALAKRTAVTVEDCEWGYKKGGYAIVLHSNAPNNSVPLLWYPHVGADSGSFRALFPRVESRIDHSTRSDRLNENLEVVTTDKHGYVKATLADFHAKA